MLDEEPASPVMLADRFEDSLGVISYHVRTLYELGLLDLVSTRQRRGRPSTSIARALTLGSPTAPGSSSARSPSSG